METILKPDAQVALLDKPQRADCKFCKCKRKEGTEWFDPEYCSGKCRNNDNPTDAAATPEKVMPKTRTGECKFCHNTPTAGTEWFSEDYCSGLCAKQDGEPISTSTTELKNCQFCGNERKPTVIWYDESYCSGKCKKQDGGYIPPATEVSDETEATECADAVVKKQEQIKDLDKQLAAYQAEYDEADKAADKALDDRNDALSRGDDDTSEVYQESVSRRDALADTIRFIGEKTLPILFKELQALQEAGKAGAVKQLMKTRTEVVKEMQSHVNELDKLLADFNKECKAIKYGFPRGKINPVRELHFTEDLRLALKRRTAVRVAQKVMHDE